MITKDLIVPSSKPESDKKIRTLSECFSFLEDRMALSYDQQSPRRMEALDIALGNISKQFEIILVAGSNNRGSTIGFTSKLLQKEGVKVGSVFANHLLSFQERVLINNDQVSGKSFLDPLNKVIDLILDLKLDCNAHEIITAASFLVFQLQEVQAVILEVAVGGRHDAAVAFDPVLTAVTKITPKNSAIFGQDLDYFAYEVMAVAKPGSWFVSSEQSKLRLQKMKTFAEQHNLKWAMPTRKFSSLPYFYEQLFGKEAALAERIVQIYVEKVKENFSPFLRGNLLATQKGQRGRPTLEAKRVSEQNPVINLQTFWEKNFSLRRGTFELIDKEMPTVLLDKACDEDAIESLFLGIRLMYYKEQINGVGLIFGIHEDVDVEKVLKMMRYLLKKVPGEVCFVKLQSKPCHDPVILAQSAKQLNLRAHSFDSVKAAFDYVKDMVDQRSGVVCIAGDSELVIDYWKQVRDVRKI